MKVGLFAAFAIIISSTFAGTVIEVDLTKGSVGPKGTAEGGSWDNGWLVTKDGNKLFWNTGTPIKDGAFEAKLVTSKNLSSLPGDKINYFGTYGVGGASLNHKVGGPKAYLRVGSGGKYGFSRMKSSLGPFAHGTGMEVQEQNFGSGSDWKTDGKTIHTLRFEWKNGSLKYTGTAGPKDSPAGVTLGKYGMQQYFFIGADNTYGTSAIGAKFISIKIEDFSTVTPIFMGKERIQQKASKNPLLSISSFNPSNRKNTQTTMFVNLQGKQVQK